MFRRGCSNSDDDEASSELSSVRHDSGVHLGELARAHFETDTLHSRCERDGRDLFNENPRELNRVYRKQSNLVQERTHSDSVRRSRTTSAPPWTWLHKHYTLDGNNKER